MTQDDNILVRLAEATTTDSAVDEFFYHGSVEKFDAAPTGGTYDGVFWCADTPAIAQCYIPSSGIKSLMSVSSFRLNESVQPNAYSDWYQVVQQMGHEATQVERDAFGKATSWRVPSGYPTYGKVCTWLEDVLGYRNETSRPGADPSYSIKSTINEDGSFLFLHASYAAPGRLFVVDGLDELRFLDIAAGREAEISDPDYHKLGLFQKAAANGYDGIIIQDWCQSETHGNVGHRSWGVFAHALDRVRYSVIPAVRFDWPEDEHGFRKVTPEFEAACSHRRRLETVKSLP